MNTPEYLRNMPDAAADLLDEYASSVVSHMARRLTRVGMTDATRYEMERLEQAGFLMSDVLVEIDKVLGTHGGKSALEKEVRDAFVEAATRSTAFNNRIYQAAGKAPQALEDSWQMQRLLRLGIESNGNELSNLVRTTAKTSQTAFIQACDTAYMHVSSGTMSATQAITDAIKAMAGDGVYVLYPTGHKDTIEVATRRAMLTGVNQTVGQIQLENMHEMGAEYVETTAHMGARPSHVPWQGQVFKATTGALETKSEFERETGYGTGEGLCGWNCRHSFFPFFPGVSERVYNREILRAYENAMVTYNGKEISLYDATQKQRQYERNIRRTKRELAGYSAGMETADESLAQHLQHRYTTDSMKLKRQRNALADLEKQTGLLSQNERQQVYGFGRSEASKSSWAVRKALAAMRR